MDREIRIWGLYSFAASQKRAAMMMKGSKFFREIQANCWDPEIRIEEYAKTGTQVQVISTIPVMFSYDIKPKDGLEVAQYLNDHIAQICRDHPKHYIGLATIPMQDEELAIKELERCKKELNLSGIQIGSNINDKNLSSDWFFSNFSSLRSTRYGCNDTPLEYDGLLKYGAVLVAMACRNASRDIKSGMFFNLRRSIGKTS